MISPIGQNNPRQGINSSGFTLIELLFVTVIMLVIIGVSTPLFRKTYDNMQLDDVSRNVAKLMKYAHERAIIERLKYRIYFHLDSKQYQVEVERDPLNQEGVFQKVEGKFGRINRIPDELSIEASISEIIFYPDGSADEVSLYLSNKSGRVYTLNTVGTRGHVEIFKYRKE